MNSEQLKIIFQHGTLSIELALRVIRDVILDNHVPLHGFLLYNESVDFSSLQEKLRLSKRKSFRLTGQGFEFILGSVGNYRLDFLEIRSQERVPPIPWNEWAAGFVSSPHFVMGWVVDCVYDHWQNAKDPLEYTAVGRSYEHLPMKSNGLPYPVEKKIIDTSNNPGRWSFCDGYIEAIGATMWLGSSFWKLTGADEKHVESTNWIRVSHPVPRVTKIQVGENMFTTTAGAIGEVQSKLRTLLFPMQTPSNT